jgi:hypothetical protein
MTAFSLPATMKLGVTPWRRHEWNRIKSSIQKHFKVESHSVQSFHAYLNALATTDDKMTIARKEHRLAHRHYVVELRRRKCEITTACATYSAKIHDSFVQGDEKQGTTRSRHEDVFVKQIPQVQLQYLPLYLELFSEKHRREERNSDVLLSSVRDPNLAELMRSVHAPEAPHNMEVFCNYLSSYLIDNQISPHFTKFYGIVNCVLPEFTYTLDADDMSEIRSQLPRYALKAREKIYSDSESDDQSDDQSDRDSETSETSTVNQKNGLSKELLAILNEPQYKKKGKLNDADVKAIMDYMDLEIERKEKNNAHLHEEEEEEEDDSDDYTTCTSRSGSGASRTSTTSSSNSSDSSYDSIEYELGVENLPVYLCMSETADFDLGFLHKSKTLDYYPLVSITFQVIMAVLSAVHTFGLKHNDLHTSNVMIQKTSNKYIHYQGEEHGFMVPTHGYLIKIIDWGRGTYYFNDVEGRNSLYEDGNQLHGQYVYPQLNVDYSEKRPIGICDNLYSDIVFFSHNMLNLFPDLKGTPLGYLLQKNIQARDGFVLNSEHFGWKTYCQVSEHDFNVTPLSLLNDACFDSFRVSPEMLSRQNSQGVIWPIYLQRRQFLNSPSS